MAADADAVAGAVRVADADAKAAAFRDAILTEHADITVSHSAVVM